MFKKLHEGIYIYIKYYNICSCSLFTSNNYIIRYNSFSHKKKNHNNCLTLVKIQYRYIIIYKIEYCINN